MLFGRRPCKRQRLTVILRDIFLCLPVYLHIYISMVQYNDTKNTEDRKTDKFILHSEYKPTGDQPQAINALAEGVLRGDKDQTLLGVTGSGKTFTMANIIAKVNRPTLILAHNKTLAAQLCSEFREFFPENAVEYFVS